MSEAAPVCAGCDPASGPGYHVQGCPLWESLPTYLARVDLLEPALAGASPADIAAYALMRPFTLDAAVELNREVPATLKGGKLAIDIRPHGVAAANKVTPELLVAIAVNIIGTSKTAAEAVVRLKIEVDGWRFPEVAP